MDDPLTRALDQAPQAREETGRDEVGMHRTGHAPPLRTVLSALRQQLVDAMTLPFFDEEAHVETTPVTKHGLTEAGSVTLRARKREPAYEATVDLEIRCDRDTPPPDDTDAAGYQVLARAHLRCDDARGRRTRVVPVVVREIEGALQLDGPALRDAMAGAISSIGKPPGC